MPELEWTRPAALAGLLVPLVLWLLSLRRERPPLIATGTFSLWRGLPQGTGGGGRRRRVPPARWLLLGALVCGVLASAGPQRVFATPPETWRVVVDPSPSMFLAHPAGGTRLDRALVLLAELKPAGVTLEWMRPAPGEDQVLPDSFPRPWLEAPWPPRPAPRWERHDGPGTVWLTDRAPDSLPRFAGVVASGGPAVPGPIGTVGERWIEWSEQGMDTRPGAPARRVEIGPGLPSALARLAHAWAAERGLSGQAGEVALSITTAGVADGAVCRVGRDGWFVSARVLAAPVLEKGDGAGLGTWLSSPDGGMPVVTFRAGRVRVGLGSLEGPDVDSPAFVVSWAELFDAAVLPVPGVVPLEERGPAGPSLARAPVGRDGQSEARSPSWPWVARLAALAAALALLALVLGRGRL
jgi:hypothetical protein